MALAVVSVEAAAAFVAAALAVSDRTSSVDPESELGGHCHPWNFESTSTWQPSRFLAGSDPP